jgi:ferredoxin-NADP reductase
VIEMDSPDWNPATVRAHRDLTPTVREFALRPAGGVKPWTVGSHLDLCVAIDGQPHKRSYSLVGDPRASSRDGAYRIAVKRMEPGRGGSRFMWSLETGAEVAVGVPHNHFPLAFGAPAVLLVAGGIGITPIVGMAQALVERGEAVRMVYAARSADELAYADDLRALLGERLATFANDRGESLDLWAEFAALPPGGRAWVCGPVTLLDGARAAWAASGRPVADLHIETFGNTGHHATEAFWVEIPRHGLRVQVPAERTLLDVLVDAGIDTLSDCKRGECGLCAMDVLRCDGTIDHRDVFFSAHEKTESRRICACVSRVAGGGVVLDTAYRPD